MTAFEGAFAMTVGEEGSTLDLTRDDRGNWTGGEIGVGVLAGSKFGISAAAFPTTDIKSLTLADAKALYRTKYWDPIAGDKLPPMIAALTFDAAVNSGVSRGAEWLQASVGAMQDGQVGPKTLAAVQAFITLHGQIALAGEMLAERLAFMTENPAEWQEFGADGPEPKGWARRLFSVAYASLAITAD